MPDITVTFTDAQWARVIAASSYIKSQGEEGDVDADYLIAKWKTITSDWVKAHESVQSVSDF